MAVLTDIIVAPTTEVPAIIAEWPGTKRWPVFETTGLDLLVLADLALALKRPIEATAIDEQTPAASADESEGPWLYVLPGGLRDSIAALGSSDIPAVADAWAKGEEAENRGLTTDIAERLLAQIQKLAAQARAEDKPLLLWMAM